MTTRPGSAPLVDRHGDSLAYFNTRRDKSVVWSASGKSAIAYRVVSGVMLASGDPVGDPEAWPGAIQAFLAEAGAHAWTPAVLGCSEQAGTVWVRETGFTALELGDEAVVDATTFTLEGRPMRNVRQMVGRVARAGYAVDVCRVRDVTAEVRDRAMADAAAWRSSATERGFSMALGRLLDEGDPECVFVAARQDGVVRAFLQFVPWGSDGMSLDVMRRDATAEAGVNELMITEALAAAPGLGVQRVSLNFAAFRSVLERGGRLGAGPVLKAWRRVLLFASRWLQIESLYRFNAKFQPQWQPRFLVYPPGADLPRVGLAALEAEAFLTWPKLGRLGGGGVTSAPGAGGLAWPLAAGRRAARRDGRGQRDPRLVQRRRPVVRAVRGDRARARAAGPGRRHPRRRWRVDPAGRRAPLGGRGAPPGAARRGGAGRRGCARLRRHHARRGGVRRRSRPGRAIVNDVSGGLADPEMAGVVAGSGCAVRRDALARATAPTCSPRRSTTTWSPTWCPSCPSGRGELVAAGPRSRAGSCSTRASGSPS